MGAFDDMLLKVGIDPKGFLDGVEKISAAVKTMKGNVVASAEAAEEAQTDANDEVAKSWRGLVVVINAANKQVVKSYGEAAKAAKNSSISVEKLIRSTLLLYGALVGSRSLLDFAKNLVTTDAAVGRLSHSLNTTPERISALAMASQRMGGSFQGTLGALRSFSDAFEALKFDGDPSMLDPLSKLSARTGKAIDVGQDFHATLLQVADALQALDKVNPQDADYLGRKITGDADLTNLLKRGRAAVEAEEAKSRKLGAISAADAKAAEKAQEAWNAASQAATGVGRTLETLVLPIVTDFFNRLAKLVEDHQADIQLFAGYVRDAGLALADWLSKVDWDGLKRDLQEAWDKFDALSRMLTGQGGIVGAMELFGTVVAASVVAPLLSIIGTLGRLAAIPIPAVLSMFGNPVGLTVAAATVGGLADAEMARRTGKAMTSGDPNAKFDPETGFVNDLDFGYGADKPAGGSNPKTGFVAWIKGLFGSGGGTGSMEDRRVRDAIITTAENTKKLVEGAAAPDAGGGGAGGGALGSARRALGWAGRGAGYSPASGGGTTPARGALKANQQEAYATALKEGLSPTAARALVANMSGESLANPKDYHWDGNGHTGHMASGIVQWDPTRSAAIKAKFGAMPHELSVTDQTRAAIWEMKNKYPTTWRALQGDNGADMIGALVDDYERPGNRGRAKAQRMGYYRGFNPAAPATTAPSAAPATPSGASNPKDGVGDAAALAAHDRIVAGRAHPGDRELIEAHRRQQNTPAGATPALAAPAPAPAPKHKPEKGVRTVDIPETSPSEPWHLSPIQYTKSDGRNALTDLYAAPKTIGDFVGAMGKATAAINAHERAHRAAERRHVEAMRSHPAMRLHEDLRRSLAGSQRAHHTTNIDRSSETTINGGLHVKTAATDARGIAADLAPHLRRQQDVGRGQYGVV